MITLYTLDTDPLYDDDLYRQAAAELSAARREKADRFRFRRDKNMSLGAGILLARGLADRGLTEKDCTYAFGPQGKPYVSGHPEIRFSLSHSGGKVIAAFAEEEIGCDIEKIRPANLNVARRFFSEEERKLLEDAKDEETRNVLFFRIWTAKESYIKAIGRGFAEPLDGFTADLLSGEIRPSGAYCRAAEASRSKTDAEVPVQTGYHFTEPLLFDGFAASVCVNRDGSH